MRSSNCLLSKKIILLILLFTIANNQPTQAQLPPIFDTYMDDDGTGTPTTPIDGFVGIVLAAGAYFGARKLRKKL